MTRCCVFLQDVILVLPNRCWPKQKGDEATVSAGVGLDGLNSDHGREFADKGGEHEHG